MGAKVYFSKTITGEKVLELYKLLGISLPGNVAVKVHSGEEGNQNFLRPGFWKPMDTRWALYHSRTGKTGQASRF